MESNEKRRGVQVEVSSDWANSCSRKTQPWRIVQNTTPAISTLTAICVQAMTNPATGLAERSRFVEQIASWLSTLAKGTPESQQVTSV